MSGNNKLFDFLKNDNCRLMLDMSKENHSHDEIVSISDRFEKADKAVLFKLCKEHELDGVAGGFAIKHGISLPDFWIDAYNKNKQHLSFLKEKAKEICEIMDQNGISMVVLKNGGIMMDIVEDVAKCPMEDIDSLVKKQDFFKAHEILVKNGFTFKFRSEYEFEKLEQAYRDGSTEYYITTSDGEKMWFELAWRAVAGRWIRPELEPDTDDFIDNSYCAQDTKVHILSPEDNLLQVCIHTAKHSYVRAPGLRLHLDVDRIVSNKNIDWELFVKKVNDTHVRISTYFSLYIPSVLFGTKVPGWVLDELKPKKSGKLLKMLGQAGLLYPKDKKFSKLGFLAFQTALYDSKRDMLRVLYPGRERMHEIYGYSNPLKTPFYILLRGFDLIGIRKKK